jgi:malonate-semialdehyde dehydrogenase (acetylating)/methylmalonate-semialdehyde dehydrogenase
MAGSVVVTVGPAKDRLLPALREATENLAVGDGLDEQIDVGPVISCASRDRITGWIERGLEDGATLLVDGRSPAGNGSSAEGSFVGPTILADVSPDAPIVGEEVFGPVLTVVHADSLDEALEIVNRSRFGNGASIFTENAAAVRRFRHEVEAGMVGINIGVAAPVSFFPFSGWKDSFLGDLHAHGPDAIEFYTRKKTVTSRYFSSGQASGAYFVEN